MRRSKLESYESILGAIMRKPLAMERIAYDTDMDCTTMSRRLSFLIENGLVQERPLPKKSTYAITERGIAVFKTLNFRRYLERISNALSAVDDAMQTLPEISHKYAETEEQSPNERY